MRWRTKLAYAGVGSMLVGLAWVLGWLVAKFTYIPAYPVFAGRRTRSVEPDWLARFGQMLGGYIQAYGLWVLAMVASLFAAYFLWVLVQYLRRWRKPQQQSDSGAGRNIGWAILGFGLFADIAIRAFRHIL